MEIFLSYSPLLIAILALLVSLRANSISKKSLGLSQKALTDNQRIMLYEKRSKTLEEIDSQNANIGTLLAILGESLTLFRENPKLQEIESGHFERVRQNVVAVEQLRARYEEQRRITESIGEGADPAQQEAALASIKRLTIHLDQDIIKEERCLQLLKDKSEKSKELFQKISRQFF